MADLAPLYARKAELLRELAAVEERIGAVLDAATRPADPDRTLSLKEAAAMFGEPEETFRRRLE